MLILIQESKTDNEKNQTIFQIQKTETATGVCKKNTEHLFFYYYFYYLGKRGLLHATIYSIFKLQKFKMNKTTKTQVHSQDGIQYFSFLCPTRSSRAKPSPAGNRKPGLQLFSSISRVVHYIAQVVLFLLESSLSFPLLWFFLPTELFQSPHLLLKVLMLIPRWGRKEKKSLLYFLEYLDVKGSLNCKIMKKKKPSKLFLTVKSILKLTAMYSMLLLAVILD